MFSKKVNLSGKIIKATMEAALVGHTQGEEVKEFKVTIRVGGKVKDKEKFYSQDRAMEYFNEQLTAPIVV